MKTNPLIFKNLKSYNEFEFLKVIVEVLLIFIRKNMKTISKVAIGSLFAVMAVFGVSVAHAGGSTVFNTNSLDYVTTTASNYTVQPGCTTCWAPTVEMAAGQVASVRVYYHNTGSQTALDTRIRISPQSEPAVNTKLMAGGVWASNATLVREYATIHIAGTPQTITYIPGTAAWFPEHTSTNPQYLNSAQEAALFSANGVSIGDILPDTTCPSYQTFCHQGSLVARFQIGNAIVQPTVYACNDGLDNDGDGLVDYPSDPGCVSPTDNDETNIIVQQAYITTSTQPATSITEYSATLNGSYATNQSQATTWFEWGTSPSSLSTTTAQQVVYGTSGTFYSQISGLYPNTTYYFRACADTNATSPSCGNVLSFVTNTHIVVNNAPTVLTLPGNCNVSQNAFSMNGSFTSNGSATTATWFQYGTTYSLGYQVGNQTQYGSSGNFNYILSGLQPNTTYYFQAVAQNAGGTAYGTILSCTTSGIILPPPPVINQQPVVTTVAASNIAQTSARINGYLNTSGSTINGADVWFEWGPTPGLGFSTQRHPVMTGAPFNDFIQGLQPDTRYFYRAMAQNNNGTAVGQTLFFSTAEVGHGPEVIYVDNNSGSGQVVMLKVESDFTSVCVADTAHYTVTYQNLTKKTLKDVVVQVILPQEETFIRTSRGSYADGPNTVTVLVGDLAGREKGTFEIEAKINSRGKVDDTLVATGTLVYTQANRAQGDTIAYSLINVDCGGGNALAGLAIFGEGSCIFWIIVLLLILIAVLATRRRYN